MELKVSGKNSQEKYTIRNKNTILTLYRHNEGQKLYMHHSIYNINYIST